MTQWDLRNSWLNTIATQKKIDYSHFSSSVGTIIRIAYVTKSSTIKRGRRSKRTKEGNNIYIDSSIDLLRTQISQSLAFAVNHLTQLHWRWWWRVIGRWVVDPLSSTELKRRGPIGFTITVDSVATAVHNVCHDLPIWVVSAFYLKIRFYIWIC